MPERTLIQKLDWILKAINDNVSNEEIIKTYNWNANELHELLEKLEKDGYIKRINTLNTNIYKNTPTIEGRLFIGYEKTRILQEEEITALQNNTSQAKIYANRLLSATWCAGIAAILLLLWQVWIWFYHVHKDYLLWFWQK